MNIALSPARILAPAEGFLARYEHLRRTLPGDPAARAQAADTLRRLGFPNVREEAWRFTNMHDLAAMQFDNAADITAPPALSLPDLPGFEDTPRLVFVQGRLTPALCIFPPGMEQKSFAQAPMFGPLAHPQRDRTVALNTMLAEDGAVIRVPAGIEAGPLLLISLGHDHAGAPASFHPRHHIHLAAGARLKLIELAAGHGTYLHNPVYEITVGEHALLTHVRLQNEAADAYHLATLYADIAASGSYDGFTLGAGARLARTEIHAHLAGPAADVSLNAAQLLRGRQLGDITTIVRHASPGCSSRQTVKHVLSGHARGVFQGKIEVARHAQQTDGYQMNQALLLSPDAEIDCKPQLEIFADDVKCSHGATVGALDSDQLFYLVSRGIAPEAARAMLVRAFLAEALGMIENAPARAVLETAIDHWWSVPA